MTNVRFHFVRSWGTGGQPATPLSEGTCSCLHRLSRRGRTASLPVHESLERWLASPSWTSACADRRPHLGDMGFFCGPLKTTESNTVASGAVWLDPAEGGGGCEGPRLARDGLLVGHSSLLSRFSHLRTGKKIKERRDSVTKDGAQTKVHSRVLCLEPSSLWWC